MKVLFSGFHFDFEEGSADLAFATSLAVAVAAAAAAVALSCRSAAATRRLLAESAANKPTFSSTQLVPTTETSTNERCAKSMPRRNQTRPLMRGVLFKRMPKEKRAFRCSIQVPNFSKQLQLKFAKCRPELKTTSKVTLSIELAIRHAYSSVFIITFTRHSTRLPLHEEMKRAFQFQFSIF